MCNLQRGWLAALLLAAACGIVQADVFSMPTGQRSLEFVSVGNEGNTGELSGAGAGGEGPDSICGGVGYTYNIGKYEVTAGQYTQFLKAVAKTDAHGLYSASMMSAWGCKIQQSGSPGNFSYTVASDWANRPVNYVSWGDAARFCNWLTNGQPTGDQGPSAAENGSYALSGATNYTDLQTVRRKTAAQGGRYYIPTEDEWYKAAYHKNDGATDHYWDYPTGMNDPPSNAHLATDLGNNANFYQGGYSIGGTYYLTEVGDFENSKSPYGTFDQGGNVQEWNEAIVVLNERGLRGQSFDDDITDLRAANRDHYYPAWEGYNTGFRVADAPNYVPEPATLSLLALGGLAALLRRTAFSRSHVVQAPLP